MAHDINPDTNLGQLAVKIYDQELGFEEHGDSRNSEIGLISGWLEGHLGELNNLIFTSFSGDSPENLKLEEQSILREMYVSEYNRKAHRRTLRGIDGTTPGKDFQTIREGDSMIQRSNKNVTAKNYSEAYSQSQARLKDLIYAYNLHAAQPNQVVGKDAPNQKSSSGLDQYIN